MNKDKKQRYLESGVSDKNETIHKNCAHLEITHKNVSLRKRVATLHNKIKTKINEITKKAATTLKKVKKKVKDFLKRKLFGS
jgi:IS1 family transposase